MHSNGNGAAPDSAKAPLARATLDPPQPVRWNPRRVSSADLLRDAMEVEIEHGGQVYRLRQTALGKLILTK